MACWITDWKTEWSRSREFDLIWGIWRFYQVQFHHLLHSEPPPTSDFCDFFSTLNLIWVWYIFSIMEVDVFLSLMSGLEEVWLAAPSTPPSDLLSPSIWKGIRIGFSESIYLDTHCLLPKEVVPFVIVSDQSVKERRKQERFPTISTTLLSRQLLSSSSLCSIRIWISQSIQVVTAISSCKIDSTSERTVLWVFLTFFPPLLSSL